MNLTRIIYWLIEIKEHIDRYRKKDHVKTEMTYSICYILCQLKKGIDIIGLGSDIGRSVNIVL